MPTDYRKLCADLFGTDDVAKLDQLAAELKTKNTRNAGSSWMSRMPTICQRVSRNAFSRMVPPQKRLVSCKEHKPEFYQYYFILH